MSENQGMFPVKMMAQHFAVSRSGFYMWLKRGVSSRVKKKQELLRTIKSIHVSSRETYGSPRVFAELRRQGVRVGKASVERLMRLEDIRGKSRRKFKVTTQSDHNFPVAPDVVQRNFLPSGPNKVWGADITYIWTYQGWLFLAVVLDLFSRRVIGWAMNDSVNTDMTLAALEMAYASRNPGPGLVHHSDRGTQYAASRYQLYLESNGATCSMSRKGNCWDNAVVESFFHTLKTELIYSQRFDTRGQAKNMIFEWIEVFYNRQRLHSTLGYMAPAQYEEQTVV